MVVGKTRTLDKGSSADQAGESITESQDRVPNSGALPV